MPTFAAIQDEIAAMLSIPDEELTPEQRAAMDAYLAELAGRRCSQAHKKEKNMTIEEYKRAVHWLLYGNVGMSSRTICAVMMGDVSEDANKSIGFRFSPPRDGGDFGRCYLLLKAIPEWRKRLPEVAQVFPEWKKLVEHWDELTTIYEDESKRGDGIHYKLYERMSELERGHAR